MPRQLISAPQAANPNYFTQIPQFRKSARTTPLFPHSFTSRGTPRLSLDECYFIGLNGVFGRRNNRNGSRICRSGERTTAATA